MLPVASLEPGVNTECRDHVLAVLISPPLVFSLRGAPGSPLGRLSGLAMRPRMWARDPAEPLSLALIPAPSQVTGGQRRTCPEGGSRTGPFLLLTPTLPACPACQGPLLSFASNSLRCSAAPSQFLFWFKLIKVFSVVCISMTLIGIKPFLDDLGTDRIDRSKLS